MPWKEKNLEKQRDLERNKNSYSFLKMSSVVVSFLQEL